MLIPAILRFLDQHQTRPRVVEKVKTPPSSATIAAAQEASGLKKIELEIAAAAGLLRPLNALPQLPVINLAGPSLEELLRTIAELEKLDQTRKVDVFE
jgi:hypothetical protein